jgi:hypothetical protein
VTRRLRSIGISAFWLLLAKHIWPNFVASANHPFALSAREDVSDGRKDERFFDEVRK